MLVSSNKYKVLAIWKDNYFYANLCLVSFYYNYNVGLIYSPFSVSRMLFWLLQKEEK